MKGFIFVLLIGISLSAKSQMHCPHEKAVYCPVPDAPLVTELGTGSVMVTYLVQPDGSVSNVVVSEYQGDPRWQQSVVDAVSTWLYSPGNKSFEKSYLFTAVFAQ